MQTVPVPRLAIPAEVAVEIRRHINELRSELLDTRADYIDRWLAITAIFLTLLGIGAVIGGYLSFKRFREIEAEARQNVTVSQQHTEKSRGLVEEIKAKRHEAETLVESINAQTVAENPAKANQAVANVQNNPEASFLNMAISQAVSLQQQGKRDDAIEKWRAIALLAEGSDNKLAARAWFSIGYLGREPENTIAACDEAIRLKPDYAKAYYNRGNAKVALDLKNEARKDFETALELARKANNAKIVTQAEQGLRDLDAAEGS